MPPVKRPPSTNPVAYTYNTSAHNPDPNSLPHQPPLPITTHHIAGIHVHIHGLTLLPPNTTSITVLWLLHPRLETHACMTPFATHIITSHYTHLRTTNRYTDTSPGLIAVSFDQRNHGSRLVDKLANEAWRSGNERHAIDMFSQFSGTAEDVRLLCGYLPGYIFPKGERKVTRNMVLGVSLGAHAAWQIVTRDERFSAAVIVVGCPEYTRLMVDRARLSKRKRWLEGQGEGFLGSEDWPGALMGEVERVHPGEYFSRVLGRGALPGREEWGREMTEEEMRRVRPELERAVGGKRLLVLSGGADKLVNYRFSEPFLGWLKKAVGKGGWFEDAGCYVKDVVFDGYGHEVPMEMVEPMLEFVNETLDEAERSPRRASKI